MISETQYGAFRGGKLIQQRGQIGGARSVFVKVKGIKNELVYPPFVGKIMNPPKGQGFKMFAGDLAWFKTDDNGIKPEVYLLKTYEVKSASQDLKTVNIVKDGYRHRPFVGDKLGVAPNSIGGSMTAATIVSITTTKVGEVEVYACVFDSAVTGAAAGKILVEADSGNKMLVKKINAVLDSDILNRPKQVLYLDIQVFGNLYQGLDIRLYGVGTPLGDSGRVFAQLLGKPLVGSLLFCQDHL